MKRIKIIENGEQAPNDILTHILRVAGNIIVLMLLWTYCLCFCLFFLLPLTQLQILRLSVLRF